MSDSVETPRFLFRYRDLVGATLPEHRKIISEHGFCWWGWWKRPNEPERAEVWQGLARLIADQGSTIIGLFDSGSGKVHLAEVTDLIEPRVDQFGQHAIVHPPAEDLANVPEYYRNGLYSRGWLKLNAISEMEIQGFFGGEYAYATPPPLSRHSTTQLSRLIGKKILDADELRGMDTTIWEISRSSPGGSTERFFAAFDQGEAPLSAQPIPCPGEWILHITDPHYSEGVHRGQHQWRLESEPGSTDTMVDAISGVLQEKKRRVGAVIVSDDLTFVSSSAEFEAARSGLFKLLTGVLELGLEHLVVIPGNHDIAWTRTDDYVDDAPVAVASEEATREYRSFFARLYGFQPSPHLSMSRRFVFPGGTLVDVVGVNSSSLEQGKDFLAGMGRVQEAGYRTAAAKLEWSERNSLGFRILTLHHHVKLVEDLESANEYRTGFGIAIDAPRVLRMAARDGVHLILHGHKHRVALGREDVYELVEHTHDYWGLGPINILGGGSAGSQSTEQKRNYFNLLRVAGQRVDLEIYGNQNTGKFGLISSWHAELSGSGNGGLRIGPWLKDPM